MNAIVVVLVFRPTCEEVFDEETGSIKSFFFQISPHVTSVFSLDYNSIYMYNTVTRVMEAPEIL